MFVSLVHVEGPERGNCIMTLIPLESPPITREPCLLRGTYWATHTHVAQFLIWSKMLSTTTTQPEYLQSVDATILQPWPTLQFVLSAPISQLRRPVWFIYSCKYLYTFVTLFFSPPPIFFSSNQRGVFSDDTVLRESVHTDDWYWKRCGGSHRRASCLRL